MSARKILLLFAHPSQSRSEINLPLFKLANRHPQVTAVDLYAEYPDFKIDIDKEQQRLLEHDVVMFQFPLYWYSTPAILKEWQDLVLEYGFAYGQQGTALKGKYFICAVTAGGASNAYCEQGYNHFSIRSLLRPLEQTANLTLMHFLPPFALFGSRTAKEQGRLKNHKEDWVALFNYLIEADIKLESVHELSTINAFVREHFAQDKEAAL